MRLYCVRHGQACLSEQNPHCSLTERGRQEVQQIANHLAQCSIKIPCIIHSGKARTQQTAEIFAQTLGCDKILTMPRILDCEADVDELIELLPQWTEDTMLVGHLPFMPILINTLTARKEAPALFYYSPATVVCLEQQYQQWLIRWAISPEIFPIPSKASILTV